MTGVDRVELAYLEHLLKGPVPLFAIVRTGAGFVLLDHSGAAVIGDLARHQRVLGRADIFARIMRRNDPLRARAETEVRRVALARCLRPMLGRMLRRHLPAGCHYLNVGHANLNDRVMQALRGVPGMRIGVLVHDTIPLDHPEFTRPGISACLVAKWQLFHGMPIWSFTRHRMHKTRAEVHLATLGRVPPAVVAALGVPMPVPDATGLPDELPLTRPYFVTIGTIEPRKNHALLLDVWDQLSARRRHPARIVHSGPSGLGECRGFQSAGSRCDAGERRF